MTFFKDRIPKAIGRPRRSRTAVFYVAFMISSGLFHAYAEEKSGDDVFALDEIHSSGLGSVIDQGLIILNVDSRIIMDLDMPFMKFSIWSFLENRNFMNFCTLGFCADPSEFSYGFSGNNICITSYDDEEISGCYSLELNGNQLGWTDETGNRVMTSFTAFYAKDEGQSEAIFSTILQHMEYEGKIEIWLPNTAEDVVRGLIALGLLEADATFDTDAPIRNAIVTLQRAAGIFPSGFISEETWATIQK